MFNKKDLYFADCKEKIALANKIYRTLGEDLFSDRIQQSLQLLKYLEQNLAVQMKRVDFAHFCSRCAVKSGGGCCSLYMADENEALQLLMNVMAGVAIDTCRDDGIECYFLAEKGCSLLFKPMFCLNYDCAAVKGCDAQEAYSGYEVSRGNLLREQWRLEQLLLERLGSLGYLQTGKVL
jgi:hypothetical protein